jgi:hypothetical protein
MDYPNGQDLNDQSPSAQELPGSSLTCLLSNNIFTTFRLLHFPLF